MRKVRVVMLLLAVVTLIGLILAVKPDEIAEALKGVDLYLLCLAACLYVLNLCIKASRWYVLVRTTGAQVPYLQVLRLFLCGLAVNNTTPGGVGGEPVKAWLLSSEKETPTGEGLATIFGERLMDLTIVIAMSITGLWFLMPRLTPEEGHNMVLSIGLLAAILASFLILALHPRPMRWTIALFDPEHRSFDNICEELNCNAGRLKARDPTSTSKITSLRLRLVRLMCQFDRGLTNIRADRATAVKAIGITVAIWINASLRYGILVLAVTGNVEAAGLIMMAAGITFSVGQFLPLGAGNVAVTTVILTAAGIASADAAAIGLLEVATSLTISVPLGMASMGLTGNMAELRAQTNEPPPENGS